MRMILKGKDELYTGENGDIIVTNDREFLVVEKEYFKAFDFEDLELKTFGDIDSLKERYTIIKIISKNNWQMIEI